MDFGRGYENHQTCKWPINYKWLNSHSAPYWSNTTKILIRITCMVEGVLCIVSWQYYCISTFVYILVRVQLSRNKHHSRLVYPSFFKYTKGSTFSYALVRVVCHTQLSTSPINRLYLSYRVYGRVSSSLWTEDLPNYLRNLCDFEITTSLKEQQRQITPRTLR